MAGQRLSHPEQSTSRRVTALSDFDYRVWEQTKLSSDDFGVMSYSSTVLRADNLRLRKATEKQVFDALRRLVDLCLLIVFEHQGEAYVCTPQWQKWQQVRFPRKTSRPCPPPEIAEQCEPLTRELYKKWPGGKAWKRDESETVTNLSRDNSAPRPRAVPANANASTSKDSSDVPEGAADWFWGQWRRVMSNRTSARIPLAMTANEADAVMRILAMSDDRPAIVVALERFAGMSDEDHAKLSIKQPTVGYFRMALPKLLARQAPAAACSRGHNPPCPNEQACTKRYLDDAQRGVA
jgi:hypothetical protein